MNIEQWFKDNDHIWRAFERQAILIARSGHKHYSARTIVEYLRHRGVDRSQSGHDALVAGDLAPHRPSAEVTDGEQEEQNGGEDGKH
mgnify:CR=1 FL=1